MKRIICLLSAFLLVFTVATVSVSANNNIKNINIDVAIDKNGDAKVVQQWSGSFYEGTENYLPISNLPEGMEITDFLVWQGGKKYKIIDNWDTESSKEEKAGKCGILETDDGIELCFGIGEYGENTYTFNYTIKGLVGSYSDKDGFNFQFLNKEINCYPTDVNIKISSDNETLKFNNDNCDIWAFGYDGTINFNGNYIIASTSSPINDSDRYMNIVVGFNKGLINPQRAGAEQSFAKLVETAKQGSDYSEDEDATFFILACIILGLIIAIIVAVFYIKRKRAISKFYKESDYFREPPCENDLSRSFYLCEKFDLNKDEGTIIAACLLELINNGYLEPMVDKGVGFMGKEKQSVNLKLVGMPTDHYKPSTALYNILFKAAGEDGILQVKELKKYSSKNPEILREFIDGTKGKGEVFLENSKAFCGSHNNIKGLTDYGKKQLSELMGYKKYLTDFSLIAERGVEEIPIWEELLVFASLFGISDKVMEQFKKVYPANIAEFDNYDRNLWLVMSYHNATYRSMIKAEQAARSQGSGGSASFGGGGGFSGGGCGGGSR